MGSLGEKIGEGVAADVHAWAPGQVVKLFKPEVRPRVGVHEARMTRAVFAAGGPAPEVLDEVTVDGRFGIVLRRFEGPTLYEVTKDGALTFEQAGAVLANLFNAIHATPAPPELPSLNDWMAASFRLSDRALPDPVAAGVRAHIERLPSGGGLCHGDLHPGNVIMTADGPVIIDWTAAVRAPGALDLARCQVILAELAPEMADKPERPRAVNAAAQAEYARLTGVAPATLAAAVEPFLPLARILFLLGRGLAPAQRERLLESVEADLSLIPTT